MLEVVVVKFLIAPGVDGVLARLCYLLLREARAQTVVVVVDRLVRGRRRIGGRARQTRAAETICTAM